MNYLYSSNLINPRYPKHHSKKVSDIYYSTVYSKTFNIKICNIPCYFCNNYSFEYCIKKLDNSKKISLVYILCIEYNYRYICIKDKDIIKYNLDKIISYLFQKCKSPNSDYEDINLLQNSMHFFEYLINPIHGSYGTIQKTDYVICKRTKNNIWNISEYMFYSLCKNRYQKLLKYIPDVYSIKVQKSNFCFFLKNCGLTLYNMPFNQSSIEIILDQMIDFANICNEYDILPLDIKPDNICIDSNMKLTIIDHGMYILKTDFKSDASEWFFRRKTNVTNINHVRYTLALSVIEMLDYTSFILIQTDRLSISKYILTQNWTDSIKFKLYSLLQNIKISYTIINKKDIQSFIITKAKMLELQCEYKCIDVIISILKILYYGSCDIHSESNKLYKQKKFIHVFNAIQMYI
jgi:hypothetical protein